MSYQGFSNEVTLIVWQAAHRKGTDRSYLLDPARVSESAAATAVQVRQLHHAAIENELFDLHITFENYLKSSLASIALRDVKWEELIERAKREDEGGSS